MITLSNGHSFEYVSASGALGYKGQGWPWEQPLRWLGLLDPTLFANVIKTLTCSPRKGNLRWFKPWDCVKLIKNGTVNAVGLTNPGIDWWMNRVAPKVDAKRLRLIGSIYSDHSYQPTRMDELRAMARMFNNVDVVALELNLSCPNANHAFLGQPEDIVDAVRAVYSNSRHPLIAKLSVTHDIQTLVPWLKGMVQGISINSVPWAKAFPDQASPLKQFGGGGVSGKAAQPYTWALAFQIQELTQIPVIAPSIWDYEDIAYMRNRGFTAFSFGSIFLRYPWLPTQYVKKDMRRKNWRQ